MVRNQQLLESETDEESRQGEDRASPEAQRPAADEITETFDVEDRPKTATPNPMGGCNPGNSGGGEQRSGSNRQRTGLDLCGHCRQAGHSTIACPRCTCCDTYGHSAETCTWCHQCQSEHCKDICRNCRCPHSHTMMCPFFQRVMREFLPNPNASFEHRSTRFQRAIQHLRHVQEEMDAAAEQQAEDRGDKRSKGKERANTQKPGGESSGTQNTGGTGSRATGGTADGGNNPRRIHRTHHSLRTRQKATWETDEIALGTRTVPISVAPHQGVVCHQKENRHHQTPPTARATPVVRAVTSRI